MHCNNINNYCLHCCHCCQGRIDYDSDGKSYYEGDWLDNVRHRGGPRCYPSGNTYDGQWYRNVRQGEGTMNWFDQNQSYSGQWEDGIQVGHHIIVIFTWCWWLHCVWCGWMVVWGGGG